MKTSPQVSDYFSHAYRDARRRLLAAASGLRNRHGVMIDSRSIGARGPEGETLALDWIQFGARRPRRVVVLSSATHGVEGFLGSALQLATVHRLLPSLRLASDQAVVMQHANNPYGFAWLRRVNESNVDLNRNFVAHFDPTRCNEGYEDLYDALNPTDLDPDNEALRWASIARYAEARGDRAFQQAVSEGQYKYPQGLQFGGQAPAASRRALEALVAEHLADADRIAWLDIHTGLGESGACELISGASRDSAPFAAAREVWGESLKSAASGDSVSTPLNGLMDVGLASVVPARARFAFAVAEYGTYPINRVFSAFRADNWLHQFGDPTNPAEPRTRTIKAEILEAFRPDDEHWRSTVIAHGLDLMQRVLSMRP
ncbi:MAG: DUF2817 domain-containing protein [Burkholderiaceae bacterium]